MPEPAKAAYVDIGGRRASRRELRDMQVATASRLISRRAYPHEIVTALLTAYRDFGMTRGLAKKRIVQARKAMAARGQLSDEQARHEAVAFYEGMIRDPSTPVGVKMMAQGRLDAIHGVDAPLKVAQTDAAGNDVPAQTMRAAIIADDRSRLLAAMLVEAVGGISFDCSVATGAQGGDAETPPLPQANGASRHEPNH